MNDKLTKIEEKGVTITPGSSVDYKSAVLDAVFNRTPVSKLFLIFSIFVYGIIAFSKKEIGVSERDLSVFLFFLIFVFITFILFEAIALFYRRFLNNFFANDINLDLIAKCFSFFTKKALLLFIAIILAIIYLTHKNNVIIFFDNIIQKFSRL